MSDRTKKVEAAMEPAKDAFEHHVDGRRFVSIETYESQLGRANVLVAEVMRLRGDAISKTESTASALADSCDNLAEDAGLDWFATVATELRRLEMKVESLTKAGNRLIEYDHEKQARIAELEEALVALQVAVKGNPAMNHRKYDGLGIMVNKALAKEPTDA